MSDECEACSYRIIPFARKRRAEEMRGGKEKRKMTSSRTRIESLEN
jgi:hypothetical protein